MIKMADVPLTEAVEMATLTPATIMNIAGNKGSIAIGKDADLVIFDEDINIEKTIIKGKVIYAK
jgi:N-acetylglucosamine-6-phosphate deacetylase